MKQLYQIRLFKSILKSCYDIIKLGDIMKKIKLEKSIIQNFLMDNRKNIYIFIIFGSLYMNIEVIFRAIKDFELFQWGLVGHTSIYMFLIGGLASFIVGSLNECTNLNVLIQSILGCIIITTIELVFGIILNLYLFPKTPLWDYCDIPFNFMGQICLPFSIAWLFLCPIIIKTDDFLRRHIY